MSELNLHDCVLHLMLTWIFWPIQKHAKIWNIDYWWFDCFKSYRKPDLALLLFNDITKAIGRPLHNSVTLPYGTYLSYLFKCLGLNLYSDVPISTTQPISYGALRHAGYNLDTTTGLWIQGNGPIAQGDEEMGVDMDDFSPPQALHLGSSLSTPSGDTAVLEALHALNARFSSFESTVSERLSSIETNVNERLSLLENNMNVRFSTIEAQMATLLSRTPAPLSSLSSSSDEE